MNEFMRFSKLGDVYLWYIRKKNGSSMEQDMESFGLRLKNWLWKV